MSSENNSENIISESENNSMFNYNDEQYSVFEIEFILI